MNTNKTLRPCEKNKWKHIHNTYSELNKIPSAKCSWAYKLFPPVPPGTTVSPCLLGHRAQPSLVPKKWCSYELKQKILLQIFTHRRIFWLSMEFEYLYEEEMGERGKAPELGATLGVVMAKWNEHAAGCTVCMAHVRRRESLLEYQ